MSMMKKRELNHILGTIFAIIDKQKTLRRNGIYNNEIILEIVVSGVYLHSTTYNVLTHTNVPVLPAYVTRSTTIF